MSREAVLAAFCSEVRRASRRVASARARSARRPTRSAPRRTRAAQLERLMGGSIAEVLAEYRAVDLLRGRTVRVLHPLLSTSSS